MTARLLLSGSRHWVDVGILMEALYAFSRSMVVNDETPILVHGHCPDGADAIADAIWTGWGLQVERHAADWSACVPECALLPQPHRRRNRRGEWYCPAAGHRRNGEMVGLGADAMVAFAVHGGQSGTRDCIDRAKAARIPVWEYRPDGRVIDPWPKTSLPDRGLW